ncbi:CPBP family glutamic-type intramembrane protease [[Eubacterium] cellulosolvens]
MTNQYKIYAALHYAYTSLTLFSIATYLFSLPLGLFLLSNTKDGLEHATLGIKPLFMAYMIAFQLPFTITVGSLFPILIFIYSMCFFTTYKIKPSFGSIIKFKGEEPIRNLFRNWLFAMPFLSGILLSAVILLQSFQEKIGVPTGSIEFSNPFNALISLSYAPIIEEIGFRITPIGTVILLYILKNSPQRQDLRAIGGAIAFSFLFPEKGKKNTNLPTLDSQGLRGVTIYEWITILTTSFAFGSVHYLFGGGWDIGKVSSAFLAGLVLALAYLWRGAAAAILLHWFFNYYGYVYTLASNYFPTIFNHLIDIIDIGLIFSISIGLIIILLHFSRQFCDLLRRKRIAP